MNASRHSRAAGLHSPLRRTAAALLGLLMAAQAPAARAAEPHAVPEGLGSLGHAGSGLEVKRVTATGQGLASIEGPFENSLNMEYLGQLTNAELGASPLASTGATYLSDIWGWTSPRRPYHEYAIVGHNSGVAFARITDPRNPVFLGHIPTIDPDTQLNFWWDMKVFRDHVYFVSEVLGNGVGIFDLGRLDAMEGPPPDGTLAADARYTDQGLLAAHNISINEETGFAYLSGAVKDAAADPGFRPEGMVILDLGGEPLAPQEVGQVLGRDTHDAQVVCYRGPDQDHRVGGKRCREIAFVFNGSDRTLGIYNVSRKRVIDVSEDTSITLSETTYAGASFTSQGWLTDDHAFLVMGDEADEILSLMDPLDPDLPATARTYVWNLQDLDAPMMASRFDSPAASIDHNLYVRTDLASGREFVYQANYTAGIRVTELQRFGAPGAGQIAELAEVAHMDTERRLRAEIMTLNFNIFEGTWGVYPFFPRSDSIIASDGLNGLVIMRLDLPAGD